jgi:limonene-1,2-epoxide hydrolase
MKSGVKLKRIESLMVNLHESKTKDQNKKTLKSRLDIEVWHGQNCIKLKVYGQLGVQLKDIKSWRTKSNFGQTPKLKP